MAKLTNVTITPVKIIDQGNDLAVEIGVTKAGGVAVKWLCCEETTHVFDRESARELIDALNEAHALSVARGK